jgi:hypothetical protein
MTTIDEFLAEAEQHHRLEQLKRGPLHPALVPCLIELERLMRAREAAVRALGASAPRWRRGNT